MAIAAVEPKVILESFAASTLSGTFQVPVVRDND